jgi:hypothetical protein
VVHFCKIGTDPTELLDEDLFGQLGIVRLEVSPSPLAGRVNGLADLTRQVQARSQRDGDKFTVKNIQVSSLPGIQFTFAAPEARVETFILGQKVLYSFYGGEDDEIYRAIVMSLRDTRSEL